tara:strand:- start:3786 stop:4001 length:216 start_codon:yes stop_codon:yes gene_type:complete
MSDMESEINYSGIVILSAICITGYYITTTVRAKQWPHVAANLIILGGLWLGGKALLEVQEDEMLDSLLDNS